MTHNTHNLDPLADFLRPGGTISFEYPTHNRFGIPLEFRPRTITITAVRDVRRDPLDAATLVMNPLRRRGSILIEGTCHECGEIRSFWLESMRFFGNGETAAPCPKFQLAIIPNDEPEDSPEPVGPEFSQSAFDSLLLAATARHLRECFPAIYDRYRVVAVPVAVSSDRADGAA